MVYNITMNDNVVTFPKPHKIDVENEETIELALDLFEEMAETLDEYGYDIQKMNADLNILVNMLIGSMFRQQEKEHFLHEAMDSIGDAIQLIIEDAETDDDSD